MKHPQDGEIRLGQGMERTRTFLVDNPDLAQVIEAAVMERFAPREDGSGGPPPGIASGDEAEAGSSEE